MTDSYEVTGGVPLVRDRTDDIKCACCGKALPEGAAILLCIPCFSFSVIPGRGDDIKCTKHGNLFNPKDVTR